MNDHIEAALAADDHRAILSAVLNHLEAQQPEPEPDYGPRPDGCCGTCPPVLGGGYDCTCADNPRCNANHADRYDCYGTRWVWCDGCGGFRMDGHGVHKSGYGRSAFWIDEHFGPLTFAPRPAGRPARRQELPRKDQP